MTETLKPVKRHHWHESLKALEKIGFPRDRIEMIERTAGSGKSRIEIEIFDPDRAPPPRERLAAEREFIANVDPELRRVQVRFFWTVPIKPLWDTTIRDATLQIARDHARGTISKVGRTKALDMLGGLRRDVRLGLCRGADITSSIRRIASAAAATGRPTETGSHHRDMLTREIVGMLTRIAEGSTSTPAISGDGPLELKTEGWIFILNWRRHGLLDIANLRMPDGRHIWSHRFERHGNPMRLLDDALQRNLERMVSESGSVSKYERKTRFGSATKVESKTKSTKTKSTKTKSAKSKALA